MRGTRKKILGEKLMREYIKTMFGNATAVAFPKILIFFFTKIEYGLYVLDRFEVLMLKMIFKK